MMANDTTTNGKVEPNTNWTIDVQRGLAWTIILIFSAILILLIARVVYSATSSEILTLLQQGFGVLTNVVLLIIGYFFGSSKSSQSKDDTQNKIVEKLTSSAPPATGPVAPVPGPAGPAVVGWWNKMTDAERTVITAAAAGDPEIARIVASPVTGKVEAAKDIAYLVSVNLLTQERATAIQT